MERSLEKHERKRGKQREGGEVEGKRGREKEIEEEEDWYLCMGKGGERLRGGTGRRGKEGEDRAKERKLRRNGRGERDGKRDEGY